jgi:hypothetical protein
MLGYSIQRIGKGQDARQNPRTGMSFYGRIAVMGIDGIDGESTGHGGAHGTHYSAVEQQSSAWSIESRGHMFTGKSPRDGGHFCCAADSTDTDSIE